MTNRQQEYGDSTIAMSTVNLLIATGGPLPDDAILEQLRELQHPVLEAAQLNRALERLVEIKLIRSTPLGYVQTDDQRRLIIQRSLDDVVVDDDGVIQGGWSGWMRRERAGRLSLVFPNETRGVENAKGNSGLGAGVHTVRVHVRGDERGSGRG